jgi:hypothetical protein
MTEIAETFGRVIGREVSYYQVPWDQFEEQVGEEVTLNSRWMNDVGYGRTSLPCGKSTLSLLPSSATSAAMDGRVPRYLQGAKRRRAIIALVQV